MTYGYADPSGTTEGNTTELISDLTYTRGGTTLLDLNYTYDSMGRISSDGTYTYTYDALGQLKTVKNSSGATVASYTYDGAGNILTATENGETVNYTYGNSNWADLLTAYDGSAITYDEVGNPTSYRGWTFGWDNGRQLTSASNGDNTLSYTYDVNGIRKSKTVNGVEHNYLYNDAQLLMESFGTTRLEFLYGANGLPYALRHSTNSGSSYTTYYYILNQQGDVVALMNGSGSIVVRYAYDAWGKVTSVTNHSGAAITDAANVANINPIRYRGYYYDTDTSLYYCLSRYYDPEVGRWINADGYVSTGRGIIGYNMFAYCSNRPVMYKDPSGQIFFSAIAIGLIAVGIGLLFQSDTAETAQSYERQQREAAKEKYNRSTVNVYTPSFGKAEEGKVNVLIDENNVGRTGQSDPNIHIENSYQITNSYEMEAILNVVIESPEYDPDVFTRGKSAWLSEWKGHNAAYYIFSFFNLTDLMERAKNVDLNENEFIPWDVIW